MYIVGVGVRFRYSKKRSTKKIGERKPGKGPPKKGREAIHNGRNTKIYIAGVGLWCKINFG